MKALILGGSGFIGSHVADALSEGGHEVTIFDKRRSHHLRGDQRFVQGDMLDREQVGVAFRNQDVVYHFAGIPHLEIGLDHPVETAEQNVLGTVITLDAARQAGIRRYVYASSIYVYSEEGSFYRCSKQAAELYIEEYQRLHGLEFTILRFGSVYGPRADDYNRIRKYLRQALLERRIEAQGKGTEMREYIHVRDAALSSVRILTEEFRNQHVLLTGTAPMRFRDLLVMIREIVGHDVKVEIRPSASVGKDSALGHYRVTPYTFRPKTAKKLVNNPYMDMGQGLLECLEEIYEEVQPETRDAAVSAQAV